MSHPPELPDTKPLTKGDAPVRQMANVSLTIGLFAVVLPAFLKALDSPPYQSRLMAMLPAIIVSGVCGAGLICGLLALCKLRQATRNSTIRAIGGVAINLFVAGLLIAGFIRGRHQGMVTKQKIAAVQEANRRAVQEAREAVEQGKPVDLERVDRLRKGVEDAVTHMSGVNQQIGQANVAMLGQLAPITKEYDRAIAALDTHDPYEFETLTNKQILQARREVIQRYAAASQQFRKFYVDMEDTLRTELTRQNVPAAVAAQKLQTHRNTMRGKGELVIQMRDQDIIRAQALLDLCDLLETRWGAWQFKKADHTINFEAPGDNERYAKIVRVDEESMEKQARLQKDFFKVMK